MLREYFEVNLREYIKNGKREVIHMPGKVKCVVCGYPTDEDLVAQCPGCNNYVCDECADIYDGYCQNCFNKAREDY